MIRATAQTCDSPGQQCYGSHIPNPRCNTDLNVGILRLSAISMGEQRLGDVIDDHCVKCRRVTNHSIVSLVDGQAAKVRCRTCYHDHDYRHEQAPPSKKDLKKAEAEAALAAENGDPSGELPGSEKPLKKATAPKV